MFGKKKTKLFGNNIEANCEYCMNSSDSGEESVCKMNHSILPDGSCPGFSYDPLKRAPRSQPVLRPHDADEFKI